MAVCSSGLERYLSIQEPYRTRSDPLGRQMQKYFYYTPAGPGPTKPIGSVVSWLLGQLIIASYWRSHAPCRLTPSPVSRQEEKRRLANTRSTITRRPEVCISKRAADESDACSSCVRCNKRHSAGHSSFFHARIQPIGWRRKTGNHKPGIAIIGLARRRCPGVFAAPRMRRNR